MKAVLLETNEGCRQTEAKPYKPPKIETEGNSVEREMKEAGFTIQSQLSWHEIFSLARKLGTKVTKQTDTIGTVKGPTGAVDMFNSFLEMRSASYKENGKNAESGPDLANLEPNFSSTASLLATISNVPNI